MRKPLKCECGTCNACRSRERQRQYRADPARAEKIRARDRERYGRAEEKKRLARNTKRWRAENPEKARAHSAVARAVRAGKLERTACEGCGEARVHAHHDDYSKPLEVRWLCARCHAAEREDTSGLTWSDRALALWNEGKTAPEIAAALQVHVEAVARLLANEVMGACERHGCHHAER